MFYYVCRLEYQMKELTLADLSPYLNDNTEVKITAYNIQLYSGDALHIPLGYANYPITPQKIVTDHETIVIDIDC